MSSRDVTASLWAGALPGKSTIRQWADRTADALGLAERLLETDRLMGRALGHAAVEHMAQLGIEEPLRELLGSYCREAELSTFGCLAARWDTIRLLRNLANFSKEEIRSPAVLKEPIERPIFITGLPRSGSTFLHRLLAEDPANRVPLCWETVYPLPERAWWGRDSRPARVDRQLRAFERLAPGFRDVYPLNAVSPQECTEITAHVFRSLRFDITHHIPSYRHWLRRAGHLEAYRFHKRFLQHLQHLSGTRPRWVLKSPDHVFALDALAKVYPDARIIFLHRDPLKVLASVAGLTGTLRAPFTRRVVPFQIGCQVADDWAEGAEAMVQASTSGPIPGAQIAHVLFQDLVRTPLQTIAALYDRFGLPLSDAAERRMAARIAAAPRGGYAGVVHKLETYGIDPRRERERFAAYTARFGIETSESLHGGSG